MQFKKFFAVLPALALSTALVAAQEPQPSSTQTQSTQTNVGQPTDTNEPVFKGCVSGTKDNYMLMTSDGQSFRLHSDKDIAEHVGKMVEVRGTIKKEGADRPADAKPASSVSEIDVADLKNVEGNCPSTGASNDVSKTDQQASATAPAKSDAVTTEAPATETNSTSAASTNNSASTSTTTEPAASASTSSTTEPAASASASTTEPSASASASTTTSSEPQASAAVSTENKSAEVSTQDQSASASTSTDASANQATDQNATASANNDQNTDSNAAALPQTASPLPLLGLLGFASTGLGLVMRRRK